LRESQPARRHDSRAHRYHQHKIVADASVKEESMVASGPAETYQAGREAGAGTYECRDCGYRLGLESLEEMPRCPGCDGSSYRRAPLFDAASAAGGSLTLERPLVSPATSRPGWLRDLRPTLANGERYLAFAEDGEIHAVPLPVGWSRIGRSIASHIRLDDPTVSRRHALVVRAPSGDVRVLDDRSLNGVHVNGERIEWGSLVDGDELEVGRFRLYLVALDPAGSRASEPSLAD
jgi:predicted Zn-ribbon and HTH transcriptional regulator